MAEVLALTENDVRAAFRRLLATFEILSFSGARGSSHELWRAARSRAADLRDLFEGIFEYSRTGTVHVHSYKTDLRREFALIGSVFRAHAKQRGQALNMQGFEGITRWRVVDAVKLRQIAGHLIVHALKWTTTGQVTLEISEWETDRAEGIRLIFRAGFVESSWRRGSEAEHCLPVIRHLCQLLHGTLEVIGRIEGELRFVFTLPCARVCP